MTSKDQATADAFATSWNNLPTGSVYTWTQFEDWMEPLKEADIRGKRVLELGCGNGSIMVHLTHWNPAYLEGVDLGDSVKSAENNLKATDFLHFCVRKKDLAEFKDGNFDVVYSIGVLHHLKKPKSGFEALLRNTKPGGKFHGWVYAREGNAIIVYVVDPIRQFASKLPWRLTKYLIATPLAIPFYLYAKFISRFRNRLTKRFPLYQYSLWISEREFAFFRHVAFDQLVTPQTTYLSRTQIEEWLRRPDIENSYIIMRNGNSWKFGGTRRA